MKLMMNLLKGSACVSIYIQCLWCVGGMGGGWGRGGSVGMCVHVCVTKGVDLLCGLPWSLRLQQSNCVWHCVHVYLT